MERDNSLRPIVSRVRYAFASAIAPLCYTFLFIVLMIIWRVFNLPSPEETFEIMINWFHKYGYTIVLFAAFLEGLVLINLYLPGSAVVLVAVVAARENLTEVCMLITLASFAFWITAQINYGIGRLGLHWIIIKFGGRSWLERANKWYAKYGAFVIVPTFFHPNLGGFVSVACGVGKYSLRKFMVISLLSVAGWNAVWGVLVYNASDVAEKAATTPWLLFAFLFTWSLAAFVIGFIKSYFKQGFSSKI